MTRRHFALSAVASTALAAPAPPLPQLCLFSKHLPKLSPDELGRAVRQFGFDGVDLTVRPAGHVDPALAASQLPAAVQAIRAHGLAVPMISTNLLSAADPTADPILRAAAAARVPFFKPGYHLYRSPDVETTLADAARQLASLAALGRQRGIQMGIHNHSGDHFGCAMWDIREALRAIPHDAAGYYFDPGHATAEGGVNGWLVSARLALSRLRMVALKDFYFEKSGPAWRLKWCPLGQGMVDWDRFLPLLAQARFSGPISLHVEYKPADLPAAIAADLDFIRRRIAQAYNSHA